VTTDTLEEGHQEHVLHLTVMGRANLLLHDLIYRLAFVLRSHDCPDLYCILISNLNGLHPP
jgi:hypothetical protein